MTKADPDNSVKAFLDNLPTAYLSILSVHELHFGLETLPKSKRRTALRNSVEALLSLYHDSILAVGDAEAKAGATVRATAQAQGRIVDTADGIIAGTALVHGLTVVTRNEKDFQGLGVPLINPWT